MGMQWHWLWVGWLLLGHVVGVGGLVVLCNKTGRLDQDETIAGRPAAL